MLYTVLQDASAIRALTEKLLTTLDEINTIAFVLIKVLVAAAPRKKHGCVSHHLPTTSLCVVSLLLCQRYNTESCVIGLKNIVVFER
jgi:hypothetical protein